MNGGSESGFKTEPIKWRVLRNAEGLVRLLSDKILDTYYYHSEDGWYHDVYWQNCLMKQWLNSELEEGGSSDAAFSPKEFDAVALKEERLGRVMLLSRSETEDPEWYADRRTSLLATDSDFTAAGGTVGPRNFGKNGAWVLREVRATAVVYYVDADGQYIDIMYGDHFIFAVRPSVYINSAKVLFTSPAVGGKTAQTGKTEKTGKTASGSPRRRSMKAARSSSPLPTAGRSTSAGSSERTGRTACPPSSAKTAIGGSARRTPA